MIGSWIDEQNQRRITRSSHSGCWDESATRNRGGDCPFTTAAWRGAVTLQQSRDRIARGLLDLVHCYAWRPDIDNMQSDIPTILFNTSNFVLHQYVLVVGGSRLTRFGQWRR